MAQVPTQFRVPGGLYLQTRLVKATEGLWQQLGNLESWALRDDFEQIQIRAPIYVSGLARSGTTILTEMLTEHPTVTSHRYCDFPMTYTPYWKNWLRQRSRVARPEPVERAHRDRIMVTEDSPEAVEEILWIRYFDQRHDSSVSQLLTAQHRNAEFDSCYRDHIRKLLLVRDCSRYLAKGNYNVSRIAYLIDLFPDARFVIPIRSPVQHIASLHKQHRFFSEGQQINPRMRFQLGAAGHFEFGLDRTAINLGQNDQVRAIEDCWRQGEEARGWGLYWSMIYRYLHDLLGSSEQLSKACLVVPYEDLCSDSGNQIDRIIEHCRLDADCFEPIRKRYLEKLQAPSYYQPDFSEQEIESIKQATAETAALFGCQV
jgi:hypothetical protein